MIALLGRVLSALGLNQLANRAFYVGLLAFLSNLVGKVFHWVLDHWSKNLAVRAVVFGLWIAVIQLVVSSLNRLIQALVAWQLDLTGAIAASESSGTWLSGALWWSSFDLEYLWGVMADCFGFWLGCHTFRMVYYKWIWAKTFTLVGLRG